MKIPLIFNANPLGLSKRDPAKIPLDAGRWRVLAENLIDSKLSLHHGPPSGYCSSIPLVNGLEFLLGSPSIAYVSVKGVGNEESFSIYLERI